MHTIPKLRLHLWLLYLRNKRSESVTLSEATGDAFVHFNENVCNGKCTDDMEEIYFIVEKQKLFQSQRSLPGNTMPRDEVSQTPV